MADIRHGLRENWFQFWTLVLVNAFVGGMVGLERSVLPELAESFFHVDSKTAILSFIIAFGITKAVTNYFTGRLANRFGRRNLLLAGWLFAIPVPILLIIASSWEVVILANVLLGINQGLAWSSTVVMKIDLVGKKERGLAMGLNEFAGYFAVGLVTFFTAVIASEYGLRPYPFYLGIVIAGAGLLLSLFVVKDTSRHVEAEESQSDKGHVKNVFWETTFTDRNLSSTTQAGLINNLNDGMIWGLLPLLLISYSFESRDIGIIAATYPAVWGIGQLFTGRLADLYSNKRILFWGMAIQGIAICLFMSSSHYAFLIALCTVLGLGTALVYPTFLVVIANNTTPLQRAESIGVFRLWRDLGYAIGALLSGLIADIFGLEWAFIAIGILTLASAFLIQIRMRE
jgi:MFS family permease